MSELGDGQTPDQWEQMLRAVLGDQAAEQILEQMRSQGIDPGEQLSQMMSPANFNAVVSQVKDMLGSSGDGPVNWKVGERMARETVQQEHYDTLVAADADRARSALQTASLWLDPATAIDPCTGPNQAWSRLDWVAHTLATFKRLTEPVGANVSRAFITAMHEELEHAPEEMRRMLGGNTEQMMRSMIASLLGMQYGAGLAELAATSFGTTDAGLPLVEGQTAALVPANVADFADGLDIDTDEVTLFVAVREHAAARLYSRVPWLRARVLDTVAAYASEIAIDTASIEERVREMGLDLQKMQELDLSEVFSQEPTAGQRETLERLEHLLSLVEGWVSAVSAQAVAAQLPHAVPLGEMFTRRSATESPANQVFGPLVGLELKPRRIREAEAFWRMALDNLGIEGRDHLWSHPDLLPGPQALDDPAAFFAGEDSSPVADELDAFLAEVLAAADGDAGVSPSDGEAGISADSGDVGVAPDSDEREGASGTADDATGDRTGNEQHDADSGAPGEGNA